MNFAFRRLCNKFTFISYARGWDDLRPEDSGLLWEHLVLDTQRAAQCPKIHFWRDKQQREVDFVLPRGRDTVDAIECKWNPDAFETHGLRAFRDNYPSGRNYLLSPNVRHRTIRRAGDLEWVCLPIEELREEIVRLEGQVPST